ncbi:MAG TPA: hypothetical protein VNT99_11060, partial [Methylomirabilota bacterium]|nr:hypothetical protein [Methylomirabilota bacterium]
PISGYWGTWSYNHSLFQSAVAATALLPDPNFGSHVVQNDAQKWVRLAPIAASYFTALGQQRYDDVHHGASDLHTLLQFSLEAHRKHVTDADDEDAQYWVWECSTAGSSDPFNALPFLLQRRLALDQAELVFEGYYGGDFTVPVEWNKYDRFRIHNLDDAALTVRFADVETPFIAHIVTVPARGSLCVRRDMSGAFPLWTTGFNYFQRFISGDPRFYQHQSANNLVNPSIVIPFVNRLLAGTPYLFNGVTHHQVCAPTVLLDPQVRAPLPAAYDALYGDPANDGTALGDCLHHRGTIQEVNYGAAIPATAVALSFTGYAALADVVAVQASGDDLQIKSLLGRDLLALSTNLFCTAAKTQGDGQGVGNHIVTPIIDGSAWFTLDRHMPYSGIAPVTEQITTQSVSYNAVGAGGSLGPAVDVAMEVRRLYLDPDLDAGLGLPGKCRLLPHTDTVGSVKTMNGLSNRLSATPGGASTFSSTEFRLTSSGAVLVTTQTIPLDAPFIAPAAGVAAAFDDAYAQFRLADALAANVLAPFSSAQRLHLSLSDDNLVVKRTIVFTGYGWPNTDLDRWTGVLTPRTTRTYSDCPTRGGANPVALGHPDFSEGGNGELTSGEVVRYNGDGAAFVATAIKVLSPFNGPNNYLNGTIGMLTNNDVLLGALKGMSTVGYWNAHRTTFFQNLILARNNFDGSDSRNQVNTGLAGGMYRFWRMEMAIEHYNNLAAKVNSMERYKPLNWIDHGVIQNGSDQTMRYRLRPNTDGIFNSAPPSQLKELRPASQYCSFPFDEGDENYLVAQYAGLAIRTITDLPNDFSTRRNTVARGTTLDYSVTAQIVGDVVTFVSAPRIYRHDFTVAITSATAAIFATEEFPTVLLKPELHSGNIPKFLWLDLATMEAYAAERGYRFLFAAAGVGLSLEVFETDAFTIHPPASFAGAIVEAVPFGESVPPVPLATVLSSHYTYPGGNPFNPFANPFSFKIQSRFLEFVPGEDWLAGGGFTPIDAVEAFPPEETFTIGKGTDSAGVQQYVRLGMVEFPPAWATNPVVFSAPIFFVEIELPEPLRRRRFIHSGIPAEFCPISPTARDPAAYTGNLVCAPEDVLIVQRGGPNVRTQLVPTRQFAPAGLVSGSADGITALYYHGSRMIPLDDTPAHRALLWADFTAAL